MTRDEERTYIKNVMAVANANKQDDWMRAKPLSVIHLCEMALAYLDLLDKRDAFRPNVHKDIALHKEDIPQS